jgi:hypothetical protein
MIRQRQLRIFAGTLVAAFTVAMVTLAATHPARAATVAHGLPDACANGTATITDNGIFGLQVEGHGSGNDVTMVSSGGNCFTALAGPGGSELFRNGDGNCLYASNSGHGPITVSATCSTTDTFEQWDGISTVDSSGNLGYLLQCTNSGCRASSDYVMCAQGTGAGSDVVMQQQTTEPDRCVWTGPGGI